MYVLSVEVVSLCLKQKRGIRGIEINGTNYLINQFVDDTSMAILNDSLNVQSCFEALNKFVLISALKINVNKMELLQLGCFKQLNCGTIKLNLIAESTRVLGIHICKVNNKLVEINYKDT